MKTEPQFIDLEQACPECGKEVGLYLQGGVLFYEWHSDSVDSWGDPVRCQGSLGRARVGVPCWIGGKPVD